MLAMETLCQRTLLFEKGHKKLDGDVHDVIANYLKTDVSSLHVRNWSDTETAPGTDLCRIKKVEIESENGNLPIIQTNESFSVWVEYWLLRSDRRIGITLRIINEQNMVIFATSNSNDPESPLNRDVPSGLYRSIVIIPANLLNSGNYHIDLLIVGAQARNYGYSGIVAFEIVLSPESIKFWYGRPAGVIHPTLEWKTEQL